MTETTVTRWKELCETGFGDVVKGGDLEQDRVSSEDEPPEVTRPRQIEKLKPQGVFLSLESTRG